MIRSKLAVLRWFPLLLIAVLLASCKAGEEGSAVDVIPEVRPVKLYYENSTGEVAITTYYYDIHGLNYLAHWQLEDSSRSSVNFYEYDSTRTSNREVQGVQRWPYF